jgi:parallel beta-helix repeat protein
MKSLDEVEPRIPIKASDLPLTITQRGSYYLTQDINFTDTTHNVITVGCNDVTIDLMGYTLKGPVSGTYSGIYINGRTNVEVRNGTVRDFSNGIIETGQSKGHQVVNVRAISNTVYGICLGGLGHLVKDCTAVENVLGIAVGTGSTVTGNTASYNSGSGISASWSTVTGNTASYNSGGISATWSTVAGNTASYNSEYGIDVGNASTVTGNTANYNTQDGIRFYANNLVTDNTCCYNGNGGDGAGIHAIGYRNRIEGNNVSSNDRGIDVDDANNLIVKNSATGNTTEYDIVGGNKVGTISTDPTTATAWANFDL